MTTRRNLLIGALCAASAGAAYQLTPRRKVSLVGSAKLEQVVPATFGDWSSTDVGDPVALNTEDSLSAKIYNQLVTRLYVNRVTGQQVMMLLAYGATQTDDLQIHRPEVCYPAFGYDIVDSRNIALPVAGSVSLPARQMLARKATGAEAIVYWSRIGETLPQDGKQQRSDKLEAALSGYIPDGILCRFSCFQPETAVDVRAFIVQLLLAVAPDKRQMLIGTARAQALRGVAAPAAPAPVAS